MTGRKTGGAASHGLAFVIQRNRHPRRPMVAYTAAYTSPMARMNREARGIRVYGPSGTFRTLPARSQNICAIARHMADSRRIARMPAIVLSVVAPPWDMPLMNWATKYTPIRSDAMANACRMSVMILRIVLASPRARKMGSKENLFMVRPEIGLRHGSYYNPSRRATVTPVDVKAK